MILFQSSMNLFYFGQQIRIACLFVIVSSFYQYINKVKVCIFYLIHPWYNPGCKLIKLLNTILLLKIPKILFDNDKKTVHHFIHKHKPFHLLTKCYKQYFKFWTDFSGDDRSRRCPKSWYNNMSISYFLIHEKWSSFLKSVAINHLR